MLWYLTQYSRTLHLRQRCYSLVRGGLVQRMAAWCGRAGLLVKIFQVLFHMRELRVRRKWTVRLATGWVFRLVALHTTDRVLDLTDALKQLGFCKSYVKQTLWNRQSDVEADLRSACFGEGLSLKKPASFPSWTQNACPLCPPTDPTQRKGPLSPA